MNDPFWRRAELMERPHKFRFSLSTPGWCTFCSKHESHILHSEKEQRRLV